MKKTFKKFVACLLTVLMVATALPLSVFASDESTTTLPVTTGIAVCNNEEELISAIDDAIQYDKKVLVEEVVKNLKEVNIAVMGNYEHQKVSEIEEVISANKFLCVVLCTFPPLHTSRRRSEFLSKKGEKKYEEVLCTAHGHGHGPVPGRLRPEGRDQAR